MPVSLYQEYEKYSKYLNKGSVDAYKEKKEKEERDKEARRRDKDVGGDYEKLSHEKRKKDKKERDRDDGSKKERDIHDEKNGHKNGHSSKAEAEEGISSLWPHLRVRIVSRSFKGGKYYSSKGKLIVDTILNCKLCVFPRSHVISTLSCYHGISHR